MWDRLRESTSSLNPWYNPEEAQERKDKQHKLEEEAKVDQVAMEKIKHPCRVLIVGKSQSGKTTLGVKLACHLAKSVDEVIICSKTYQFQDTWRPLKKKVTLWHDSVGAILKAINTKIKDSISDDDHKEGTKVEVKRLLIFDDVSGEKHLNAGGKGIFPDLIYNAVWYNLTIMVICHRMYNVTPAMRENVEYLIILNLQPKEQQKAFDEFGITKSKTLFFDLFNKEITDNIQSGKERYPFLFVDFKAGGLVYFKFRERITLGEETENMAENVEGDNNAQKEYSDAEEAQETCLLSLPSARIREIGLIRCINIECS